MSNRAGWKEPNDCISANMWMVAAVSMTVAAANALLASRLKLAAALVEIVLGTLAGNLIGLYSNAWVDFVAAFGSIMLTFLAGAEIDPAVLRAQLIPSLSLGFVSLCAPFACAWLYALFVAHWSADGSKVAGIAMSTTSVAVVYAVLVESGLAKREFGQLILDACFFTNLGTVVALGLLFATYDAWLALLVVAIGASTFVVPKLLPPLFERMRPYVSEPALRILFAVIFVFAAIATYAKNEGVLPAYFLGLACAGMMLSHADVRRRLQTMTMTLLMATGLTFGTISSLYGLTHHYIDQAQYTALVTVVILTAAVPTVIAQALFRPTEEPQEFESEVP